ncbi:MAG: DUF3299 domain-containing protein [Pseudomonadales bacterium]
MFHLRTLLLPLIALLLSANALASDYKTLDWEALIPPGFDLAAQEDAVINQYTQEELMEDEALSMRLDQELQALADAAPVVDQLNKQKVRVPGFVVPLELDENRVRTFLLVPYYGACIHMPPPPANQVILVSVDEPFVLQSMFDPVWVQGELAVGTKITHLGTTGYQMSADGVTPYDA